MRFQSAAAIICAGVAVSLLGFSACASAETITLDISFTASGAYNNTTNTGKPPIADSISGNFEVTFDNAKTYTSTYSGVTGGVNGLTLDGALGFEYDGKTSEDQLAIGQDVFGANNPGDAVGIVIGGTNDFSLIINNVQSDHPSLGVEYAEDGGQLYSFTSGTLSVTRAVPESSTWAMMMLGFCGVGAMTYRRRKRAALAI
jgi:hypothetical protein